MDHHKHSCSCGHDHTHAHAPMTPHEAMHQPSEQTSYVAYDYPDDHYMKAAVAYHNAGDFKSAVLAYMQRDQRMGPNPHVYLQLARLYRSCFSDAKEALRYLSQCAKEFPGFIAGYAEMGDLLLEAGQYDKAVRCLNYAIKNYEGAMLALSALPNEDFEQYIYARANLGYVRYEQGQLDKALRQFRSGQAFLMQGIIPYECAPGGYLHLHLGLAMVLRDMNQIPEALACLRAIQETAAGRAEMSPLERAYLESIQGLETELLEKTAE